MVETKIGSSTIKIYGIAKGSGMIYPNMATTLGYIFTDATLSSSVLNDVLKNNIKTTLINVVGVESLLEYMNNNGGGDFLFLSTSEIYGNPPDDMIPTPEEYQSITSKKISHLSNQIYKYLHLILLPKFLF